MIILSRIAIARCNNEIRRYNHLNNLSINDVIEDYRIPDDPYYELADYNL